MVNRLFVSWHVASTIDALNADDTPLARKRYSRINLDRAGKAPILTLGARISLLERDSDTAASLLRDALSMAEARTSENAQYVACYCKYFLGLIRRSGAAEAERLRALELTPSKLYLTMLPFPEHEIPIA